MSNNIISNTLSNIAVNTNPLDSLTSSYSCVAHAGIGSIGIGSEIKINKERFFKRYDVPGSYIYVDAEGVVKQTYIKYVLYRNPATIVFWGDGTKTVSKADAKDQYCPESGLAICILKKLSGASEVKDLFIDWTPEEEDYSPKNEVRVDLRTLIKKYSKKKKAAKKNSK